VAVVGDSITVISAPGVEAELQGYSLFMRGVDAKRMLHGEPGRAHAVAARLETVEKEGYVQHHVHVQISPEGKLADFGTAVDLIQWGLEPRLSVARQIR
jgi:hypothetical protein